MMCNIRLVIRGLLLIIGAIAMILIGYFYSYKFILFACCLIPIICYLVNLRYKHKDLSAKLKIEATELDLENMISLYGEPDSIIVTNPTKPREKGGAILIYKQKDAVVANGKFIYKKDITDVELKNIATPYIANDYQITISTTLSDTPYLYLYLGDDALWADNVYKQIVAYLHN